MASYSRRANGGGADKKYFEREATWALFDPVRTYITKHYKKVRGGTESRFHWQLGAGYVVIS